MLNGYRLTGEPEYLRRAVANAEQAARPRGRVARRALPLLHVRLRRLRQPGRARCQPPWHSGMAQGRALLRPPPAGRGDRRRRAGSRPPSASTRRPSTPAPQTTRGSRTSTTNGYLWFEEYPSDAPPPRVLNGHNSALIGFWKRALVTGDAQARRLFDGARHDRAALREGAPPPRRGLRLLGPHAAAERRVPPIHVTQLRTLAALTGDPRSRISPPPSRPTSRPRREAGRTVRRSR